MRARRQARRCDIITLRERLNFYLTWWRTRRYWRARAATCADANPAGCVARERRDTEGGDPIVVTPRPATPPPPRQGVELWTGVPVSPLVLVEHGQT